VHLETDYKRKLCGLTWKYSASLTAGSLPIGRCPERIWLPYDVLPRIGTRSTCRRPRFSIRYFKTPDGDPSGPGSIGLQNQRGEGFDEPFHGRRLGGLIGRQGFQQGGHPGEFFTTVGLGGHDFNLPPATEAQNRGP
jgi:hypothetical protein